jgi:glycosyltransferase involved in cell wall biosynthesis
VRLYVGGLGLHGDGYPNAARTIQLLERLPGLEIVNCGKWLPKTWHLWKITQMPRMQAFRCLLSLVFGNLRSLLVISVRTQRAPGPVYVPYPSVFFLFWASFLPARWRPECIVDAYISIWDSLVRDRSGARLESLFSRTLKWIEGRGLRAAAVVLVDTQASEDLMVAQFDLQPSKVRSIPLAIDESSLWKPSNHALPICQKKIKILFVGTLIPLHGIDVILSAIELLLLDSRFEFRIIGSGQLQGSLENFIQLHQGPSIIWIREWASLSKIAEEIKSADICLGVFGGNGKAGRVLPLKMYMYLALGRACISQSSLSTPAGVAIPPIVAIAPSNAGALATAISELADDPAKRNHLAQAGYVFYKQNLGNSRVTTKWLELLTFWSNSQKN